MHQQWNNQFEQETTEATEKLSAASALLLILVSSVNRTLFQIRDASAMEQRLNGDRPQRKTLAASASRRKFWFQWFALVRANGGNGFRRNASVLSVSSGSCFFTSRAYTRWAR
jgi:hypothetical protein